MQLHDQILTTISNELNTTADAFDFDSWITLNGFDAIKPLFVKYGLNHKQNLNTLSKPFAALVSDPTLSGTTNAYLLPKVVTAIQKLSHTDKKNDKKSVHYLVISEKEQSILQSLQSNMKELRDTESRVKGLENEFKESGDSRQNRLEQIARTKYEIDAYFDAVQRILIAKRSSLLGEIASIEQQQQCFGENNSEDRKEMEIIAECNTLIAETSKMLSTATSKCQAAINPTTAASERQNQMIRVNNNAIVQYLNAKQMLDDKLHIIESAVVDQPDDSYSAVDVSFFHKANETRLATLSDIIRSLNIHSARNDREGGLSARLSARLSSSQSLSRPVDVRMTSNARIDSMFTVHAQPQQRHQVNVDEKLDWKSYSLFVLGAKKTHDSLQHFDFLDDYAKSRQIERCKFMSKPLKRRKKSRGHVSGHSVEMQFDGMTITEWAKGPVAAAMGKCASLFVERVKREDIGSIEMAHDMRWRQVLLQEDYYERLHLYARLHELEMPHLETTKFSTGRASIEALSTGRNLPQLRFTTVLKFLGESVSCTAVWSADTMLRSRKDCVTKFIEEHMLRRVCK